MFELQLDPIYKAVMFLMEELNHNFLLGFERANSMCCLQNVIHGDIKPENLLIGGDGLIKICDFGVSCLFEDGDDEVQRSPGTPIFTAPECCVGVTYHGKAADIWALGCTLYCMVLGRYPFKGETLQSTYEKVCVIYYY
jgi:serine/threonine protein kinase